MSKVLVLGATGMLGSSVSSHFRGYGFDLQVTFRPGADNSKLSKISGIEFDAETKDVDWLLSAAGQVDYVVNCIGVTKSHITDSDLKSRSRAVRVNSDFSLELARVAEQKGIKVLQIATDCVFSGAQGRYLESDLHDATDVYGKTKSLGEAPSSAVMHLRVSTVGPEISRSTMLFEWVRNQPLGASITGFTNHRWNGVTTHAFSRILGGIIGNNGFRPGVQHVVPEGQQSKDQLVRLIAQKLGRDDLQITACPADHAVDRTLDTADASFNQNLWADAGYPEIPSIETLLAQ